jgi:hypothetical protein
MPGSIMALTRRDIAVGQHDSTDPQQRAPPGTRERVCPRCGRPILRVRRRLIDRLFSLTPVHRYRCYGIDCGWVGNLPPRRAAPDARNRAR